MKKKYTLISIVSLLVFLAVWELATEVFQLVPAYSLPSPAKVFKTFITKFYTKSPDGSTLIQHLAGSLQVAFIGYLLGAFIGIPLGVAMGWFPKVDKIVKPIFDFLKPIPPISIIPVMILLFGIGLQAKAAVIFFSAFIPCVVNSYSGIHQTRRIHLWVSSTFGASNLQQLWTVAIPSALPMIFTGFKVSLGAAWMSLVAAELLAATRGVGYMIQIARTIGRADLILVGMLTIGLVGLLFAKIFDWLEKKYVRGGM